MFRGVRGIKKPSWGDGPDQKHGRKTCALPTREHPALSITPRLSKSDLSIFRRKEMKVLLALLMLSVSVVAHAQTDREYIATFKSLPPDVTKGQLFRLTPPEGSVIDNMMTWPTVPCPSPQPGVTCQKFFTRTVAGEVIRFRLCQTNASGVVCTGCNGVLPCENPDRFAMYPVPTVTPTPVKTATAGVATATPQRTASVTPKPTVTPTSIPPNLLSVDPTFR
jgi:hypothetical protein